MYYKINYDKSLKYTYNITIKCLNQDAYGFHTIYRLTKSIDLDYIIPVNYIIKDQNILINCKQIIFDNDKNQFDIKSDIIVSKRYDFGDPREHAQKIITKYIKKGWKIHKINESKI